jgi:hypothetical protein
MGDAYEAIEMMGGLPPDQLVRPHREHGRCPLGDECPCWQEGYRQATSDSGRGPDA